MYSHHKSFNLGTLFILAFFAVFGKKNCGKGFIKGGTLGVVGFLIFSPNIRKLPSSECGAALLCTNVPRFHYNEGKFPKKRNKTISFIEEKIQFISFFFLFIKFAGVSEFSVFVFEPRAQATRNHLVFINH